MSIHIQSTICRFGMYIMYILSAGALTAMASCGNSGSSSSSAAGDTSAVTILENRLDAIHEQSMKKIGPLRELEDSLRAEISAKAGKGADTAALSRWASALHVCDTTMFGWMAQYDGQMTGKTDSGKAAYLQTELQKLTRINDAIDSTMQQARKRE